ETGMRGIGAPESDDAISPCTSPIEVDALESCPQRVGRRRVAGASRRQQRRLQLQLCKARFGRVTGIPRIWDRRQRRSVLALLDRPGFRVAHVLILPGWRDPDV